MGRSSDEKGAEKAVAIRRAQQKERGRIAQDITESQKKITVLNEERAPIAAEVRKVEAEVGPIKYIAAFIYGTAPDETMLEKAVTWIIILIVIVFDPLAVIMLLAAQMTFGWSREQKERTWIDDQVDELNESKLVADEILTAGVVNSNPHDNVPVVEELEIHPDEGVAEVTIEELTPEPTADQTAPINPEVVAFVPDEDSELAKWNKMIEEAEKEVLAQQETTLEERLATGETYINEEGVETPLDDDSKKKTYMTKNEQGQIEIKNR
jgi:hypothetical protein